MRDALGTSPLPEPAVGPPTAAAVWHPAVTLALVGGGIVALYFGQTSSSRSRSRCC